MSLPDAPSPIDVLMRLWDAGSDGISLSGSAQALAHLRASGCIIEESPGGDGGGGRVELQRVGLGCYRDVIEREAQRKSWRLGKSAHVYHRTSSTNDACLRAARSGINAGHDGFVAVADVQSAGRGRRGNAWVARGGQSVLLSVLLRVPKVEGVADRLTLLAGLAAAEAIDAVVGAPLAGAGGGGGVQIKWPNDLLIAGRKFGGILVEGRGDALVVGLGVNVAQNAAEFPADLRDHATSLYMMTGRQIDRLRIIVAILGVLDGYFRSALEGGQEEQWIARWKARCPMLGQRIKARDADGLVAGQVLDVDPLRGLLVRDELGAMRWLAAQTTTLSV